MRVDDMKNVVNAARTQAKAMVEKFEEKCKNRKVSSPKDIEEYLKLCKMSKDRGTQRTVLYLLTIK